MRPIETVIQRLGYSKSEKLYRLSEINECSDISWHDKKILRELAPYAAYIMDNRVVVIFFESLSEIKNADIHKKIWNAQVPVVISDEGSHIQIYNGKSMSLSSGGSIRLRDIISYDSGQCDEKNDFSYWNITSSLTKTPYAQSLAEKNLNGYLIDNLKFITKKLNTEFHLLHANKLMLRVLFIRYLIDRGINIGFMGLDSNVEQSRERLLDIIQNKRDFLSLINYLKGKFNGNLFEMDEEEAVEISDNALALLHDFLTSREELESGQLLLFPYYDFNIIPIGLISNIYEILLGKEKRANDKAFYTLEYLADYIVNRTVGNYLYGAQACTVLDPSCGSGIFLVKSLQKILERNADPDGFIHDRNKINTLVKENIYGVDCNNEAVDVTIFSLYIALCDYIDPKDSGELKFPLLKGTNILCGDFFDAKKMEIIDGKTYKFILGNPPWGSVKQDNYKMYCKKRNITAQGGEICVAFLERVQEIGNTDTECSLIIPSKLLYKKKSPSIALRNRLLSNAQLEQVLEISSVRKQIFKGAVAPAAVLSFTCTKSSSDHKIEYISLKPNKYLELFGIIMIEPDDVKYVEQKLLLENDILWKILVYGGYWDFELVRDLQDGYSSIRDVSEAHGLIMKKGLQDNDGDRKDSSQFVGRKILDSDKAIDHFYLDENAYTIFNKERIHRPRDPEIYKAPYVLFRKGLDCSDYSIKAVYTEKDFLYREAVNCIKGSESDRKILLNLCGLLNSSLFAYLNLMLGSSAGIEREQVFLDELGDYPYAYSDELVNLVLKIQHSNSPEGRKQLKHELDQCVMKMFGLQDDPFVDFALSSQIPMLCGTYQHVDCNVEGMKEYISVLFHIWDTHFGESGIYHSATVYPNIKGKFAAIQVKLSMENTNGLIYVQDVHDDDIDMLVSFMIYQLNDCFYQTKNIVEFSEDSFVIVKPIESKNWHPAMAVKDSYQVLNKILLGKEA